MEHSIPNTLLFQHVILTMSYSLILLFNTVRQFHLLHNSLNIKALLPGKNILFYIFSQIQAASDRQGGVFTAVSCPF